MEIPFVWIKNKQLINNALAIIKEIAKREGVKVIEVKPSDADEIYINSGGRTCIPNIHYTKLMLENPNIYFTKMDQVNVINKNDIVIVEKEKDLEDLEDELIERIKISKAYFRLPKIDCGKCGRKTCYEFAVDLVRNKADLRECVTLVSEKKLVIKANGKLIFLNPWLQDLVRKTVMALLTSLKGVEIKGDEKLLIEVR